jgi:hypothetical protein
VPCRSFAPDLTVTLTDGGSCGRTRPKSAGLDLELNSWSASMEGEDARAAVDGARRR